MRGRRSQLTLAAAVALAAVALAAVTYVGAAAAQARRHRHHHRSASCAAAAAGGTCRIKVPAVGTPPLSDSAAAALVKRSPFEPRPDNAADNQRVPSAADLNYFLAHSDMPYKDQVTGNFTGTTDEIIQWAAYKHDLDPNLLRAVAVVESHWHMSTVGDNGDSFGLFQIRRPYHCCDFLAANDTAFNADYYGAIIRAYYDGRQTWLNTVAGNGAPYHPADIWGSVGAWYSGRWRDPGALQYIAKVKQTLRQRTWRQAGF